MDQYTVTGMSCAACQARVEKAVSKVDGVTSCNVSLLTNTLAVEGTAAPETIMQAVENAGYGAASKGTGETAGAAGKTGPRDAGTQETTPDFARIFTCAHVFFHGTHDVRVSAPGIFPR